MSRLLFAELTLGAFERNRNLSYTSFFKSYQILTLSLCKCIHNDIKISSNNTI